MSGSGRSGKAPLAILLSVPQRPVAITWTRTSSSPTSGLGTWVTSRGSENRVRTAALMAESYQPLGGSTFHSAERVGARRRVGSPPLDEQAVVEARAAEWPPAGGGDEDGVLEPDAAAAAHA